MSLALKVNIGSDNGLVHQAITWANADTVFIATWYHHATMG